MSAARPRSAARSGAGPPDGRARVVIEGVRPEIDAGRFPIKRVVGEDVVVEADVFVDGHDAVACALRWRKADADTWSEERMEPIGNDRWRASFTVSTLGRYEYTVVGWVDRFAGWQRDLRKKVDAEQAVSVDLLQGAEIVHQLTRKLRGAAKSEVAGWIERLEATDPDPDAGLSPELADLMDRLGERRDETVYERVLEVAVSPTYAAHSTWYELFPRSASDEPGTHGTLRDAEARLPYVHRLGFDVLYLPPIHPIGVTKRKGRNNAVEAHDDDVGSPWAIGSEDGGHTEIHPDLGTFDDFDRLLHTARDMGIELALDIAFQASPDHPWVKEHPEWFRHRPDGTVQFAENPPKRYEDIYPLDFTSEAWLDLWTELREVIAFWVDRGVHIFRVDNPHTKPFPFWEWVIGEIKRDHPEVLFLSEAFTRPKVMYRLAKLGFDQSYTYFTWRNAKWEIEEYFTELTRTEAVEFFRPNLWPNTPDILSEFLQYGGRPAFMARLVLAATLGANYGIYGPAFELGEHVAVAPGKEEYLDAEKYEIRTWDLDHPASLADFIALVNGIRHANPALHSDRTLRFHEVQNDNLIAYTKKAGENVILTVVNLDPHHVQAGMMDLRLDDVGISTDDPYQVHDLLTRTSYVWHGGWNYVELDPFSVPAHVFRVEQHPHRERDFDYFA